MNDRHIQAVLFDLDGTLIEFHREFLFAETERILPLIEHDPVSREIMHDCFADFDYFRIFSNPVRDEFVEKFWGHFNWDGFPEPELFHGTISTLEGLRREAYRLALVTSRFVAEEKLRQDLAATRIPEFLDIIRPRPGDHIHWTDKRTCIREVCEKLGIKPAQAAMVGDIPADIESARDVGVGCVVGVLSGGIRRTVLERAKPHYIITDVSELPQLLGVS